MSKMIIEEYMHGHILIRNSVKGAVFEIQLPMQLNYEIFDKNLSLIFSNLV